MLTAAHILRSETEKIGVAIEPDVRNDVGMRLLRQLLEHAALPQQSLSGAVVFANDRP